MKSFLKKRKLSIAFKRKRSVLSIVNAKIRQKFSRVTTKKREEMGNSAFYIERKEIFFNFPSRV